MSNLYLFCLVALVSAFALFPLRQLMHNALDVPNNRSMHTIPIIRGGGIVIVTLTIMTAVDLGLWMYALTASVIAFMGWMDDRNSLSVRFRLFIQIICAILIIMTLQISGWVSLKQIDLAFTLMLWIPLVVVYVVYMTNIYNFMDGIDGMASGAAVIAGFGWIILNHEHTVQHLSLVLAASSLGFLAHNWSPARVFMGDVGSTFLGFSFATISLMSGDLMLGILMFWVFIFDAGFTIVRRLLYGENIFKSHRTHLYQRLVSSGLSHRAITTLYLIFMVIGVYSAWLWSMRSRRMSIVLVLGLATAHLIGTYTWEYIARKRTKPTLEATIEP